jgi:hypothetical protein
MYRQCICDRLTDGVRLSWHFRLQGANLYINSLLAVAIFGTDKKYWLSEALHDRLYDIAAASGFQNSLADRLGNTGCATST